MERETNHPNDPQIVFMQIGEFVLTILFVEIHQMTISVEFDIRDLIYRWEIGNAVN